MAYNWKDGNIQQRTFLFFLLILIFFSVLSVVNSSSCFQVYAEPANIPSLFLSIQVEGNPNIIHLEKGRTLYKIMAYKEAAAEFSRIEKVDQQDNKELQDIIEESLYLRANSLMKIGDYSGAMALIDLIPGKSRFYRYGTYTRAMISLNISKEEDTIKYLKQIVKNSPAPRTANDKQDDLIENLSLKSDTTLGFIYLERNNPEEAIKHFAVIPRESPFYTQALFGSGWAYATMGRWVRTVVFWEELVNLYPEDKYAREVVPFIGHAYVTLSAYGKALEQNGIALRYYEDILKRFSDIEQEINARNIKGIAHAIEVVGDKDFANEWDLFNGLLYMEEYISGHHVPASQGNENPSSDEVLINALREKRRKIIDGISKSLRHRIEDLKHQLRESSVNTSLEIAGNLRLEGGGHISNDMIFDDHD